MDSRRVRRLRVGIVATVAVLAVVLPSLPTEAAEVAAGSPPQPLPVGASTTAPVQQTGAADQPPSVTGTAAGPTVTPSTGKRPPSAVPEARTPKPVRHPAAVRRKLTNVPLKSVGKPVDFDQRTSREIRTEWTEDSRVYQDADGTTVRRLYPVR